MNKWCIFFIGMSCLAMPLTAQTYGAMTESLQSERESVPWGVFRQKVRAALPEFTLTQLEEQLSELQVAAKFIGGDIMLQAGGAYNLSLNATPAFPLSSEEATVHNFSIAPELVKTFVRTGTTLKLSLNDQYSHKIFEGNDKKENTHTITPTFSISQNLLQNFFGLLYRLDIAAARQQYAIAQAERESKERALMQAYDTYYLSWLTFWRAHKLLAEQVAKSKASYENAQNQRRLNYIDKGSFERLHLSYLNYQQNLFNNERELLAFDQRFRRFLGEGLYRPDDDIISVLLNKAQDPLREISFQDSWAWDISRKNLDLLQIVYRQSRQSRLPNLVLSTSLALKNSATFPDGETPDYGEVSPTYSLGLTLSWPLLMRKAKNAMAIAQNNLQQLETNINKQEQEFVIGLANRKNAHTVLLEVYELQKKATEAQATIYASEKLKYQQARSGVQDLLLAEINQLNGQLSILQTENQLILQLLSHLYETRAHDILAVAEK